MIYRIVTPTTEKCTTLELFVNQFVMWRQTNFHWMQHWPQDATLNKLADGCFEFAKGNIEEDEVSLEIEENESAALEALIVSILKFASTSTDGDFVEPSSFSDAARILQWETMHNLMCRLRPKSPVQTIFTQRRTSRFVI